ncbi:hypothetical protein QFC24_005401 [Naganishia onofrii]|uniref:Uncharacterized protein n=1 Tax=Naganishia onofrii TaxID=1851511 RepID=A0ACC2X7D0_9TREE|nr:hypothetical protein QFC24_005401 [Naganishia onofrii]
MNTGSSASSGLNFSDDEVVYLGGLNDQASAYYRLLAHAQVQNDDHEMRRDIPNAGNASNNRLITSANHHSMITRQNARENAVNEEEDLLFDMEYDQVNVANDVNDARFIRNGSHDYPDWAAAFDAQNSPPFVPSELGDVNMEGDNIMNNIQVEPILPIQLGHLDHPIQPVLPIPPLHPVQAMILPLPAIDVVADIVAPKTPAEKREMVQRFRDEVWRDEVKGMMREDGMDNIDMDYNDQDMIIFIDALQNVNATGTTPVMVVGDIMRHDWTREGNCVYTLRAASKKLAPPRGSGEILDMRYLGVKRALWQYWAHRPAVHLHHIESYQRHFGFYSFFRVIMWHHLPENQWHALWKLRRVSSRD